MPFEEIVKIMINELMNRLHNNEYTKDSDKAVVEKSVSILSSHLFVLTHSTSPISKSISKEVLFPITRQINYELNLNIQFPPGLTR
ncbi:MAG: hypothetical protein HOG49_08240 [Candidatus Scalindua sp.]|jgi:hypothetical protein|nr:hypothetical protein [Candidatus Scalindua sp.]